ncbi:UNVERIFIED_CONTAM: putative LRR receptor-like serine/threonine-protein kinase [Sesamum radiatum]|uniref:LRR receptor-like serine/threonine-protein kinase n=1 Tax=Sesamum radiatum TaxID=300843 RepID=A0AAW2L0C7_SESRA
MLKMEAWQISSMLEDVRTNLFLAGLPLKNHQRCCKRISLSIQGTAHSNSASWPPKVIKHLLDSKYEPLLSDYGLVPVMNKDHAQQFMVAYKSPESTQKDRVTRKTDVWSLGILILELLTGRFPANYLKQGKGPSADLATWVNSVVKEEWTGEVFDKDMNSSRHAERQMFRLLKIGMCCCEWNVDMRWDLKEAVERIMELKERDDDDDYYSCASEGDMYSSRAMTDDDLSFSSLRS